ncbi:phosphatase PAP2 family protein [uncultured Rhodoblastus sp.]|uniref:phosphatase PAP2 family protein n=1 Tax=uncultured Rhodoblastus sp. TaxID=543037 RepID=UPI0025CD24AD|nr:phosphatase PAP2 family protein [uncultured Rhodoblastus sp.]
MTRNPTIRSLDTPPPSALTPANPGVEASLALAAESLTDPASFERLRRFSPRMGRWIETLQEADLESVRILSRTAQGPVGRRCAIVISKLGNGWFYLFLAALLFARWGWGGARIVLLACVNAGVMHSLYPRLKRRYRRRRPFRVDPELSSLLATLDEHSFPSGHAMTLSAVLAPIVMLWPAMAVPGAMMWLSLAWSRVATAHHYPSDVLAGALLGLGLGYPVSAGILSLW